MINYCLVLTIFRLFFSTPAESVGGCSVYPTFVVVTVGERVLLSCSTNEGFFINSWHVPIDLEREFIVYKVPAERRGQVVQEEILAEGYSVTHPANNETILHINETALSHAGLYICTCVGGSTSIPTATIPVIVLASEPMFTPSNGVTDGGSVTFSCSMSFNASAGVSWELKIEDASRFTVARRNESTVASGLNVCNLKHTIIANASSDQWHTCNATLFTKGSLIYSSVLNATADWQLSISTTAALSSITLPAEAGDITSQKLVIGVSVTIVVVVVIIAVVIFFLIRRSINQKEQRIRQLGKGRPSDQSLEDRSNKYDKPAIGSPIPIPTDTPNSSFDAAQQDMKSLNGYELTLCENELYEATPRQLDPSDGYYTEGAGVIYDDIK